MLYNRLEWNIIQACNLGFRGLSEKVFEPEDIGGNSTK